MRRLTAKQITGVALFFLLLTFAFTLTPLAEDTVDVVADTSDYTEPEHLSLVYVVTIEGAIGTVTDERIDEAIDRAEQDDAELLVIKLNTPGGFTAATWNICKNILNSEVPVCVYISPMGARAGSAGVYMTYAAHFAAMSPASNIGAAHPVSGGGEIPDSIMNEKITNDAVAQIKAAAEKRGRNAEWAESAVRESVSITSTEALELNVIDLIAEDMEDLLGQLDGQEAETPREKRALALSHYETEEIEATFAQKLLEVITNPNIVFILFSIGGLGIMLELYNPGSIFPGVVGAISMILAFYASSTLPVNYAAVALIFLAIVLWIAEIKVISHGLLTIGGIISFFLGGLMLIDTVDPELKVSMSLLITMVVIVGIIVSFVGYLIIKAQRNRPAIGNEGMIGKKAQVRGKGMVYVNGALWKAESTQDLVEGAKVVITEVDGLILKVRNTNS